MTSLPRKVEWVRPSRQVRPPALPQRAVVTKLLGRTVDNLEVVAVYGTHPGTGESIACLEVGTMSILLHKLPESLIDVLTECLVADPVVVRAA